MGVGDGFTKTEVSYEKRHVSLLFVESNQPQAAQGLVEDLCRLLLGNNQNTQRGHCSFIRDQYAEFWLLHQSLQGIQNGNGVHGLIVKRDTGNQELDKVTFVLRSSSYRLAASQLYVCLGVAYVSSVLKIEQAFDLMYQYSGLPLASLSFFSLLNSILFCYFLFCTLGRTSSTQRMG